MDRKIEKKRWTVRRIGVFAITAIFVGYVAYTFFFSEHRAGLNVQANRITIATVTRGAFREYIPVTGTVIPIRTIYLDAIEGGRVKERFLEAGASVQKGDSLVALENTNLLLDIMRREAEFFDASNNLRNTRLSMQQNKLQLQRDIIELDYNLKNARRKFQREKKLNAKNLTSEEKFSQAKDDYEYIQKRRKLARRSFIQDSLFRAAQIDQLESSLVRMQKNLAVAKQKLDNLLIRAPVSGLLTSLNAEIGESKRPGERLGQVDVLDGFKVRAGIDEHYLPRISPGQMASFSFAGGAYKMIIRKVFPEIRDGVFDCDLEFAGSEPAGLRRGQSVHLRLELGTPEIAVLLPRGGFYQKTGGRWIFVVEENSKRAQKRQIRLGRQNPEHFEVLQGIKAGEKVIISSYDAFGENDFLLLR